MKRPSMSGKNNPHFAHGKSLTREFATWQRMLRRCDCITALDYPRYGGRGIKVCERWQRFESFYEDMGDRPSPLHSLDRIDNDKGYEPGNCRWATRIEQANNKRTSHLVEYRGTTMTIADAVRVAGSLVTRETARNRIATRKWPVERAVETPNAFRRDPKTRKVIQIASAE